MRGMARRNFNTTVDEGTIAAIDRLAMGGKSKGQVIDEAVGALEKQLGRGDVLQKMYERQLGMELKIDEILEMGRSVPAPAGTREEVYLPAARGDEQVGEFTVTCVHCGERFHAATRYATLCKNCQGAGHRNVRPADCRECQLAGTGAI